MRDGDEPVSGVLALLERQVMFHCNTVRITIEVYRISHSREGNEGMLLLREGEEEDRCKERGAVL